MPNHTAWQKTVFTQSTSAGRAASVIAGAALAIGCALGAQQAKAQSLYAQYGAAERNAYALTLGAQLPWRNWQYTLGGGVLDGHWDISLGRWHAPLKHGRPNKDTWVLAAAPVLRWRGAHDSPWFMQAGLGLSLALNRRYATQRNRFSTRYNFVSHIGAGRTFGIQNQHEMLLRVEHHSNASIKRPNPGENFLHVRYAWRF